MSTGLSEVRKSRIRAAGVMLVLAAALFGALSGESTYVFSERVTFEPRTREVVATCKVIGDFESVDQAFRKGQPISRAKCQEVIDSLPNPENVIEATFQTENYEEQIVSTVRDRDWGAEFQSRGLRFIIGGVLALVLVLVVANGGKILSRLNAEILGVSASRSVPNPISGGNAMAKDVSGERKTGGLVGVFDFGFQKFLTPVIVRILYALTTVVVALGAVVFWYSTVFEYSDETASEKFTKIVWATPLSVIGAALVMLLVRLLFESVVVVFRIAEDLRRIRDK